MFVRNGISLDYCFEASINSMRAVCDHVFVTYCESNDGTLEVLEAMVQQGKLTVLNCNNDAWEAQKGKEKLSYFQNISIQYAQNEGYEYVLLVQADEVLHQDSIPYIKRALALK